MRRVLTYAALWVALAIAIGSLIGSINIGRYREIAKQGVKTNGTVLTVEPHNHQTVRYSYQVSEITHSGSGTVGVGNPDVDTLAPGDSIVVYYAANAPATSVLGDPRPRYENELVSVALAALLFPSLVVGGLILKLRRQRQ
jgi:Protein of unknown function (DUF3592)